jgi:Na+/proline symporter
VVVPAVAATLAAAVMAVVVPAVVATLVGVALVEEDKYREYLHQPNRSWSG